MYYLENSNFNLGFFLIQIFNKFIDILNVNYLLNAASAIVFKRTLVFGRHLNVMHRNWIKLLYF